MSPQAKAEVNPDCAPGHYFYLFALFLIEPRSRRRKPVNAGLAHYDSVTPFRTGHGGALDARGPVSRADLRRADHGSRAVAYRALENDIRVNTVYSVFRCVTASMNQQLEFRCVHSLPLLFMLSAVRVAVKARCDND